MNIYDPEHRCPVSGSIVNFSPTGVGATPQDESTQGDGVDNWTSIRRPRSRRRTSVRTAAGTALVGVVAHQNSEWSGSFPAPTHDAPDESHLP